MPVKSRRITELLRRAVSAGAIQAVVGSVYGAQVVFFEWGTIPAWAFWAELSVCLVTAVSGRWPRAAAVIVALLLAALWFGPVDAGRFTVFTGWIIVTSLGAKGLRGWSTSIGVLYLVEVAVIEVQHAALQAGGPADPWSVFRWMAYWVVYGGLFWGLGQWFDRVRRDRRRLVAEQEAAMAAQRTAIARDLHDTLAGTVTGMIMRAQELRLRHAGDPAATRDLDGIIAAGNDAMRDVRALMDALRRQDGTEPSLEPLRGPGETLRQVAADLEAAGFPVRVLSDGNLDALPDSVRRTLVRVIEEAAVNVRKHAAPGSPCEFMVGVGDGDVEVVVTNVVGDQAVKQANHVGLVGLRERVEALGGELATSRDAGRHLLQVSLPLRLVDA